MKFAIRVAIALFALGLCGRVTAQQTRVIINLTEQTAYLIEDGRVAIVSPIASGKMVGELRSATSGLSVRTLTTGREASASSSISTAG